MNNNMIDNAYNKYFGNKCSNNISPSNAKEKFKSNPETQTNKRTTADGSIDNIDSFGEILRKLLNAAWGNNWGILSPETSNGEDPEKIILPQINYAVNLREIADGFSPKPQCTDVIKEVVNGQPTGDCFKIFRQTYDCIVEIDFFDTTSKSCRELMAKFEELINTYTGYLKREGLKEIFFLKEVPAKYSLNYIDGIPMKSLYYFIRIEKAKSMRLSVMNKIEQRLSALTYKSTETKSDDINKKITYKL